MNKYLPTYMLTLVLTYPEQPMPRRSRLWHGRVAKRGCFNVMIRKHEVMKVGRKPLLPLLSALFNCRVQSKSRALVVTFSYMHCASLHCGASMKRPDESSPVVLRRMSAATTVSSVQVQSAGRGSTSQVGPGKGRGVRVQGECHIGPMVIDVASMDDCS
jgi:hypothetical protein